MNLPAFAWRMLACGWCLTAAVAPAKDPPATPENPPAKAPPLLLSEVWVPATALDPILSRYPRAVALGRDQLFTLLHDAHAADPAAVDPAAAPPERAVLRQARFDGRLVSGPDGAAQVQVSAELEIETFSDRWTEVPLGLRGVVLGTAEIDDGRPVNLRQPRSDAHGPWVRLSAPGKVPPLRLDDTLNTDPPATVLIQGRGTHRLRLGFLLPVETRPDGSAILLPAVDGIGEFALHLPAGARGDCERGCAVQPDGAGVVARVALRTVVKDHLTWRTPPPASGAATAVLQGGEIDALVGESAVTIRQKITLTAALGRLPGETRLALPPEARAVRVEGAAATRWDLGADGLRVELTAPEEGDSAAAFEVIYELPLTLDPGGAVTQIPVPLLEAAGAHRVAGNGVVRHGAGVQVRRIEPGAVAAPGSAGANAPGFVAGFSLADLPAADHAAPPVALTLEARRAAARFSVDADARADFQRDGVHVQRTLTFHVEEGEVFTARVVLPKWETFLDLQPADGSTRPDWRQEGDALVLTWNTGLREGSKTVLILDGHADLAQPKTGAPVEFSLAAARVPGAERLTGYVALAGTPALRLVTTGGEERLERRDGRTTPVLGDVAWFYRDDFHLALRIERRATETEARFTGDALPLAGAVEIHGQIDYHFLYAGLEAVKIRVPADTADAFFFTGAHIAERRRDGDVWTIRFQGEQTGDYTLGVRATIPTPADKDDPERFHFRLPTVAPLETARWSGVWAVEANTDTEIGFHVVGANEVDTLHAPALAEYQPRRRVIGVFEFLGGGAADAAVDLDGVRHPAAVVAAAVVDSLTLETFASTSGVARHRATLRARTAADGFFNLRLPDGAALWSLTRDGELVKPVGGAAGGLRVELPGGREPSAASTVVAIYETPGQPWTSAGRRTLAAPRFDPGVPVLASRWTLHVPDGFDYRMADGLMTNVATIVRPGDLLLSQIGSAFGYAVWWVTSAKPVQYRSARVVTELDMPPVLGEPVQELIVPKEEAKAALKTQGKMRDEQISASITRKLDAIVIPSIEFRATTLSDAIEFLRQESRRLDPDPDPEQRGVNIFLKLLPANAGAPAARITLTMRNLPLIEAVKYVAQQAGMKVKVEPYAVAIVPLSEVTDVLVTEEIKMPPTFITSVPNGKITPQDAKTFLEASGVVFPPGASATYLASAGKLVVRNTQENLDLIESLTQENSTVTPTPDNLVTLDRQRLTNEQVKQADSHSALFGSDKLATAEFSVASGFLASPPLAGGSSDITGVGSVTIQRQDAKSFLEAQGFNFPPGASAIYLPSTGKLVLRSTPEAIKRMADLLARSRREKVAGLLPIRLHLPNNGQAYEFAGGGEPGTLDFQYTDWRSAARRRWVWLTLGGGAFLLFAAGWAHPWRRTVWVVLALTFFPLVAAPAALVPCNALLAGWLWAVLGWGVTRFLLRRRRLAAAILGVAAASLPILAHAAPSPDPTPAPSPEMVIVPYDATRPAAAQQPDRYYLPYERFLTLWDAAKRHRRPALPAPPPGGERYSLNTARYDARLVGDTLEIDATLDLQTFGDGWVAVPLGFDGAPVGALTLDGAPAALSEKGVLSIGTPGAHRVAASLRLPAGKWSAGARLAWSVPPTAATLVTLLLPRPDLRAEIGSDAPGGGVVEEIVPEGRRFTASAGGATHVELSFRDAPPPAPENGPPALARVVSRLVVGARQETIRPEVKFSFPGRTQNHFTVSLDPGLTLTDLDAPDLREWHLSTGGDRQTLDLTLNAPARDTYTLSLQADRPTPGPSAARRTFPVVTAQAGRVEQTAVLLTSGALEITLPDGPPAGARRTEFSAPADEGRVFGAFESDGSSTLVYSVSTRAEKRTAHIDYLYQVGRGRIEWAAAVQLVPAAGGPPIQTADLRLPAGVAVQAVAGRAVRQWWRDGDVLALRFQPGPPTEVSLIVYLVQPLDRAPDRVALRPLEAAGFAETDGQAVVAADPSLRIGLTLPTGARARDLSEIDPATAADEFQVKVPLARQSAFRYRGAAFEVGAALDPLPARWQAQTVTRATVREGAVTLETRVNVETRQGALDTLEFSLPAGLPEARVSGPEVREAVPLPVAAGQDRRTYRVLFQNPVYGGSEAALTVSLDLPLDPAGAAALPDLQFPGGQPTAGFLLVENASSGEMTLTPRGLDPAAEKDVPFLPAQIVAGTRFFRVAPGVPWSLDLAVANLEKTAGRAALVAYAALTSTLRADGEEWHRAAYRLQNRRLQFLPVELPSGVEFIGARVAGESVRVDAGLVPKDGHVPSLLVPLLKTRPGELSYDVELIYRRPAPTQGKRRSGTLSERWRLEDPRLPGIPVEKTLWDVYLPGDTRLLNSGGNLEPVVAALSETEKLESALSDLRGLSATSQSAGATRQEQQLALRNFNALASTLQRDTNTGRDVGVNGGWELGPKAKAAEENVPWFQRGKVASQNGVVNQKQQSIRRELDSLNAANAMAQTASSAADAGSFAGDLSSRGPSMNLSNGVALPSASSAGTPRDDGSALWRDNRTLDQNRTTLSAGRTRTISGVVSDKKQLALNDSVTVDLPSPSRPTGHAAADKELGFLGEDSKDERLSTARAAATSRSASRMVGGIIESDHDLLAAQGPPAVPALPAPVVAPAATPPPPPALAPEPADATRTETLRSTSRISLAVNFPQEGQVYHFEKLQADARLSLWAVRPARLDWLAWLAVLLVGLAAVEGVRWAVRRRMSHASFVKG